MLFISLRKDKQIRFCSSRTKRGRGVKPPKPISKKHTGGVGSDHWWSNHQKQSFCVFLPKNCVCSRKLKMTLTFCKFVNVFVEMNLIVKCTIQLPYNILTINSLPDIIKTEKPNGLLRFPECWLEINWGPYRGTHEAIINLLRPFRSD